MLELVFVIVVVVFGLAKVWMLEFLKATMNWRSFGKTCDLLGRMCERG